MREEKKFLTAEYVERINASPYFIVADYTGLNVSEFNELRARLLAAGAAGRRRWKPVEVFFSWPSVSPLEICFFVGGVYGKRYRQMVQ